MNAFTITVTVCFDDESVVKAHIEDGITDVIEDQIIEHFETVANNGDGGAVWIPHHTVVEGDKLDDRTDGSV